MGYLFIKPGRNRNILQIHHVKGNGLFISFNLFIVINNYKNHPLTYSKKY